MRAYICSPCAYKRTPSLTIYDLYARVCLQSVRRWEDALAVADSHGLPGALELRRSTRAALESGHEEARAGALAEADGELEHAVRLYLAGGAPGRAAALVLRAPPNALPVALVIATRDAVAAGGLLERAGALCERLGDASAAIAHYVSAHAFRPAVDLARRTDPGRVVSLESAWGSWLVGSGAPEEAVAHFIEAIDPGRAIDACILSGQAGRAAALLGECFPPGSDGAVPDAARPYWRRLAVAAAARGEAAAGEAERCVVRTRANAHLHTPRTDGARREFVPLCARVILSTRSLVPCPAYASVQRFTAYVQLFTACTPRGSIYICYATTATGAAQAVPGRRRRPGRHRAA